MGWRRARRTEHDVCVLGLFGDEIGRVEVADDDASFGVFAGDLSALLLGPSQDGVFPVGVGLVEVEENITTDVACGSSAKHQD